MLNVQFPFVHRLIELNVTSAAFRILSFEFLHASTFIGHIGQIQMFILFNHSMWRSVWLLKMIKFRYKRKESSSSATNAGAAATVAATTNATANTTINTNNNNKANVNNLNTLNNGSEHKSNDAKTIDTNTNSLKREMTPKAKIDENKSAKTKGVSDDEYLADCIRAVVVSELLVIFHSQWNKQKENKKTHQQNQPNWNISCRKPKCCANFFPISIGFISGIISTIANELRASPMSRSAASCIGQRTVGRPKIPIGLFGRCSRMFRIAATSRPFAFIARRNGQLQSNTVCGTSAIRNACGWTECLRMRRQFGTVTIHTGKAHFLSYSIFNPCIHHVAAVGTFDNIHNNNDLSSIFFLPLHFRFPCARVNSWTGSISFTHLISNVTVCSSKKKEIKRTKDKCPMIQSQTVSTCVWVRLWVHRL